MTDFYSILKISENASQDDIRKAYRRLAKQCHPDINDSDDAHATFVLVNKAYEVLMDGKKRSDYDRSIKVASDPYYSYNRRVKEREEKDAKEAQKRYNDFLNKKEKIRGSTFYYPYKIILFSTAVFLIGLCLSILVACIFAIVWYHLFMFFFLLPFICLAAYLLKVTIDEFKKYRAFFS